MADAVLPSLLDAPRDARDSFFFFRFPSFSSRATNTRAVTENTNNRHYTRSRRDAGRQTIETETPARARRRESLAAMTVHRSSGCHNTAVYAVRGYRGPTLTAPDRYTDGAEGGLPSVVITRRGCRRRSAGLAIRTRKTFPDVPWRWRCSFHIIRGRVPSRV